MHNGSGMQVGKCYYVRSLTDHWVGEVVSVNSPFDVTLKKASWIADTGVRLSNFMKNRGGDGMEVEYVGDVTVQWIAYLPWDHEPFTQSYPE